MDSLSTPVVSAAKLPILNLNEFDLWKMRIEQYFLMTDYSLWEVILNGDSPLPIIVIDGVVQPVSHMSAEQKLARRNELKARGTLLMVLPDKHQLKFNSHKDAKTLMEAIEKRFGGTQKQRKFKRLLKQQFKNFTGSSSENLDQIHDRLQKLVSQLKIHGVSLSQEDVNLKFLRISAATSVFDICATLHVSSHPNIIDVDDLDEINLRWQMAMLTMKAKRFLQKTGINLGDNRVTSMGFDMSKMECYNCHRKGHFARECRSPKDSRRSYQAEEEPTNFALMAITSSSSSSDNKVPSCSKACSKAYAQLIQPSGRYHAVPPPITGTFMPPKPNLVFHTAPIDVETDHSAFTVQLSPSKPTQDLSYTNRPSTPIIEDWVSDFEDESETNDPQSVPSFIQSSEQVKTPRHSVQLVEAPILDATLKPTNLKSNISSKRKNRKTCFVCRSVDHLIKDCDFYAKKKAQPKPRNYAHRVLTRSKPVSITAVRPVCADVPKIMVSRPRHAHTIDTKSKSPIRRHITRSPSPKTSNSSPRVTAAQAPVGNPQYALKDKVVIDSGCSRHMTGNMSYLSDFEELNDGYVAFGGNPKGGKISGKGKIKTGKLDFEDVYFVKELKFNLFSVSQMCDKKNKVLFTDIECLVLCHDFKLPDESQVLFRVPRENNMYNVNLKNIVPSGDLTCLFAKATIDESNLWHRRLGHINFKTINKLVKGNLVRGLPTKVFKNNNTCVACKKGKQHRASYKTKPVSSIDQPLFRLHMDLFGLTFVKSLNKKSYCLVITDDFSRFTWVFFLATKDETSPILKTFITGLENQLSFKVKVIRSDNRNEFKNYDLNQLCELKGIKSEFSVPRTPQQNGIAERKNMTLIKAARTMLNNDGDAAFDGKEHYVDTKKPESVVNVSPSSRDRDLSAEFEDCSENSSNEVNAARSIVLTAGPTHGKSSFKDASQLPENLDMLEMEDITYSDHETIGAEADFNNLETSIIASPIATTRTHKDHPISQLIGDLSSTTQTRSMTKVIKDQGGLSHIFSDDFHTCMFACFLSQEEPKRKVWILVDLPHEKRAIGTKWVYKNKKDERGIVVRNKARLVAQGHTQEKGIDYEEVFAPVARIEAIRLFLARASFMGFMVYQMDVKSAFLYGTIEEEVYVYQPTGFEEPYHPDKAPRAWYETLANYLLENGFHRAKIDQTLFIKKQKGDHRLGSSIGIRASEEALNKKNHFHYTKEDHLDTTERIQYTSNLENNLDFEEATYDEEVQAGEAISLSDEEITQDEAASEASIINLRVALKCINARRLPLALLIYIMVRPWMTTSVENNYVFRSFFEKQKITGPNFINWYRQLRVVLLIKDKDNYLEHPIPAAPVAPPGQQVPPAALAAYAAWVKGQKEVNELKAMYYKQAEQELLQTVREFHTSKQEEGQSVSSHVLKMKGYIENLERLGQPVGQNLAVSLILVSLNKDFDSFVQNYTGKGSHGKGKGKMGNFSNNVSFASKPKTPSPPRKDNPAKDAICHQCGEVGHWRRNFPVYLAELMKKKKLSQGASTLGIFTIELYSFPSKSWIYDTGCGTYICITTQCLRRSKKLKPCALSLYVGDGHRTAVEEIGTYHLELPSRLVIVLNNCHYAPSITRGVILVSRLFDDGFVNHFDDNNVISVSKNNLVILRLSHGMVFQKEVENQLGKTIKSLRSDHEERRNQTLLDMVRSMMSQTTLPKSFWDYALETAARILNMVPTKKRDTLTKPDKLDPRSFKSIFVGYPKEMMGYSFYSPSENKVFVARKAEFFESKLLDLKASGKIDEPQSDINPIRKSSRTRHAPDRMCLYIDAEEHELGDLGEPANYKAALLDPESKTWLDAMNVEMQSMKDNDVWVLVELPPNARTIRSKWFFKKKTDMDGAVYIFKARLVAKGFTQTYGVDYEETFSHVADIRAIRILIAIAAYYDYEIWQMDVKTAFLNGNLSKEVYMEKPEGFVNLKYPNHVCQPKRSIYGLKQASRQWNKRFDDEIKKFGFTQNPDEPCVYIKASGSYIAILILYVDDILLMGNNIPMLKKAQEKDKIGSKPDKNGK
nr:ribonuclease H-like domain-containing protein [Tanacetum cinerariifolium]